MTSELSPRLQQWNSLLPGLVFANWISAQPESNRQAGSSRLPRSTQVVVASPTQQWEATLKPDLPSTTSQSRLLFSVSALFFFDIPLCIAFCFELFSITLRIVFSFTSLIQHYSSPASTRYVRPHPHAASSLPIDGVSSQPLHPPASSGS